MDNSNLLFDRGGLLKPEKFGIAEDDLRSSLDAIDWDFAGFIPTTGVPGIHGLHWYPASFPPGLVGTMLDILGQPNARVLDPFCGSGVVPIEAWTRGMIASGLDINQFAIDLAEAKADLLSLADYDECEALCTDYTRFREQHLSEWQSADEATVCRLAKIGSDANRWFTVQVLRELAVLKSWLAVRRALVHKWERVLRMVVSSILHNPLSVVRSYHYTYIVDRSKVKTECREQADVAFVFVEKLRSAFMNAILTKAHLKRKSNGHRARNERPEFIYRPAREAAGCFLPESFDLVLTSPPYFGMNDYVRSQYLSWLVFQWPSYETDIRLESGSRRIRNKGGALDVYLDEMAESFRAMAALLRPRGLLAVVFGCSVGNFVSDRDPVSRVREILGDLRFELRWTGTRRVRFRKINNTPYRSEVLWVFERQS